MPSTWGPVYKDSGLIGSAAAIKHALAAVTRMQTRVLVLAGVVRPAPPVCEWGDCAVTKVEVHHPDTNDPTLVRYLCRIHHRAAERV